MDAIWGQGAGGAGLQVNDRAITERAKLLLYEWEGSTGEYSVQGWQGWPDHREGQYRSREPNILQDCQT